MNRLALRGGDAIRALKRLGRLGVLCAFLPGCTPSNCVDMAAHDDDRFVACLLPHESLKSVKEYGQFTALELHYNSGPGSLGHIDAYTRLLYRGRTVVPQARDIARWDNLPQTVLFADFVEKNLDAGTLHIVYEQGDKAVVETIHPLVNDSYTADYEFPYGFPMGPGRRYFQAIFEPDNAGFLLQVLPTRVTRLPLIPDGIRIPFIKVLAGIAPDGQAYAYTDDRTAPSVIGIVDSDGTVHDPVPIPFQPLETSADPHANPFEPVWRWFAASFAWQRDKSGKWTVAPLPTHPVKLPANPVEELFIDGIAGYRTCFSGANAHCSQQWQLQKEQPAGLADWYLSPYRYTPPVATRAFDANVSTLLYSRASGNQSGYQLLLDAPPDQVIAALNKRLQDRGIPFVRIDRCPGVASYENTACKAQLQKTIHWHDTLSDEDLRQLFRSAEDSIVLMTPTLALGVYPAPGNRTFISTLARYDVSAARNPGAT